MRRTTYVTMTAVLLVVGLLASPALAERYDNFRFPTEVVIGERTHVTVYDCYSGEGWTAEILVRIYDADGNRVKTIRDDADDDGTTRINFKISNKRFDAGKYKIRVKCIHHFDGGGTGTWFNETHSFMVVESV